MHYILKILCILKHNKTAIQAVNYINGAASRNRTYIKALPWPRNTTILLRHIKII